MGCQEVWARWNQEGTTNILPKWGANKDTYDMKVSRRKLWIEEVGRLHEDQFNSFCRYFSHALKDMHIICKQATAWFRFKAGGAAFAPLLAEALEQICLINEWKALKAASLTKGGTDPGIGIFLFFRMIGTPCASAQFQEGPFLCSSI